MDLHIKTAEVVSGYKNRKGKSTPSGLFISFKSLTNVIRDQYVILRFNSRQYYFKITDITVNGEHLDVDAIEVGYSRLGGSKDLDLRNLIDMPLEIVTDPAVKDRIRQESTWC